MDRGLKDLRAVIISGTKGIGCSTANILAAEGCHVSVCARNKDEVVDFADKAALEKFIANNAKKLGRIDIMVANVSALAVQHTAAFCR